MKLILACLSILASFAVYGQQDEEILMWTHEMVACRNPMPGQPEMYRWGRREVRDLEEFPEGDRDAIQATREDANRLFLRIATMLCGSADASEWIDDFNRESEDADPNIDWRFRLVIVGRVGHIGIEFEQESSERL